MDERLVVLIIPVLALAGSISLGIFLILWTKRRLVDEEISHEFQSLEAYRKLLDDGELDPHEFEQIQHRLDGPPKSPGLPKPEETGSAEHPSSPPPR